MSVHDNQNHEFVRNDIKNKYIQHEIQFVLPFKKKRELNVLFNPHVNF